MPTLLLLTALSAFYLTLLRSVRTRWALPWRPALVAAGALWAGICAWALVLGVLFNLIMSTVIGG